MEETDIIKSLKKLEKRVKKCCKNWSFIESLNHFKTNKKLAKDKYYDHSILLIESISEVE